MTSKICRFSRAVYDETVPSLQNPNHNHRTKRIVIRVYSFIIKLWLKIGFIKVGRIKEIRNVDPQPLADLMNHAQFHRIVCAVDDIADGGLGHAAFYIKLILRHIPLAQEFLQAGTDRFV